MIGDRTLWKGGYEMDINKFASVIRKYKKCPKCGASWKGTDIQVELQNEIVEVKCTCGFLKRVDHENNEIEDGHTKVLH